MLKRESNCRARNWIKGALLIALFGTVVGPVSSRGAELCRYMVVAPDADYAAAVADLVAWKARIGFSTCVVQVDRDITPFQPDEPDEATRIWNYLRSASIEQGVEYVVLAGDVDVLPMRMLYPDGGPGAGLPFGSDYYYANLNQPDWDVDGDDRWGEWVQDQVGLWSDHEVVVARVPLDAASLATWSRVAVTWEGQIADGSIPRAYMAHGNTDYRTLAPPRSTDGGNFSAALLNDILIPHGFATTAFHELDGILPSSQASDGGLASLGTSGTLRDDFSLVSLSGHGNSSGFASHVWASDANGNNAWDPHYKDKSGATPEISTNGFARRATTPVLLQGCSTAPLFGKDPGFAESALRSRYLIRNSIASNTLLKQTLRSGAPVVTGASAGSDYGAEWMSPADGGTQTLHYYLVENLFARGKLFGDAFFEAEERYWREFAPARGLRVFNLFGDPALDPRGVRVARTGDDFRIHDGPFSAFATDWDDNGDLYVAVLGPDRRAGWVYSRRMTLGAWGWVNLFEFDSDAIGSGGAIHEMKILVGRHTVAPESEVLHLFLGRDDGLVDARFSLADGSPLDVVPIDVGGDLVRQVSAARSPVGMPGVFDVHLAWTAFASPGGDEVRYSHSADNGARWRAPRSFPGFSNPDLAVEPGGRVHLVAVQGTEPRVTHITTSENGGIAWGAWSRLGRPEDTLHFRPSVAASRSSTASGVYVFMPSAQSDNSVAMEAAYATFPNPQWRVSGVAASQAFDYRQPDVATPRDAESSEVSLTYAQDAPPGEGTRQVVGRALDAAKPLAWPVSVIQNEFSLSSSASIGPRAVRLGGDRAPEWAVVYGAAEPAGVYLSPAPDPSALKAASSRAPGARAAADPPAKTSSPVVVPRFPRTWYEVGDLTDAGEVTDLLATGSNLLAATVEYTARGPVGGVRASADWGATWSVFGSFEGLTALYALAAAPAGTLAAGVLEIAGNEVGVIYRDTSGAGTWEPVLRAAGAGVACLHVDEAGGTWAGGGGDGSLWRSGDGGASFQRVHQFGSGWEVLSLATEGKLLAAGLKGPDRGAVMISDDDGDSWTEANGFESPLAVNGLRVWRGRFHAAVRESHTASVYVASPDGLTWTALPSLAPYGASNVRCLAEAPDGRLLAGLARPWGRSDTVVLAFDGVSWAPVGGGMDMADVVTDLEVAGDGLYASTGSVYGNVFFLPREAVGTWLAGRILDRRTGTPIAGAQVSVEPGSRTVTTDAHGVYGFSGMVSGAYAVTVAAAGFIGNGGGVSVIAGRLTRADYGLEPDQDGDGISDGADAFPSDPAASVDTDGDGHPDAWNPGKTQADSTTGLTLDLYPGNPQRWSVVAMLTGVPASPTLDTTATITVGGADVVTYRYLLDGGPWSANRPLATLLVLDHLGAGEHIVGVVGCDALARCQADGELTRSTWQVAPWPLGGVSDLLLEEPKP